MGVEQISAGNKVPEDINVVIEIPANMDPVKYEMDKDYGVLTVDRFLSTSMVYPCNYGYVPSTLSEDGDPIDVLVVTPFSLVPGCLIRVRPIGMLRMTDDAGKDTKILAVPIDKLSQRYKKVTKPEDLGKDFINMIEHFFTHYKDLEEGKWAKVEGWEGVEAASKDILAGVERFKSQGKEKKKASF